MGLYTRTSDAEYSGRQTEGAASEITEKIYELVFTDSRISVHELMEAITLLGQGGRGDGKNREKNVIIGGDFNARTTKKEER